MLKNCSIQNQKIAINLNFIYPSREIKHSKELKAPVVQWIEQFRPKEEMGVRFFPGAPR